MVFEAPDLELVEPVPTQNNLLADDDRAADDVMLSSCCTRRANLTPLSSRNNIVS